MTIQPLDNGNYATISDFIEATVTECRNTSNRRKRNSFANDTGSANEAWYGGFTGLGVQKACREGWQAGMARMAKILDKLDTSNLIPRDMRRRISRADMGDHLDISAVYAGRWQSAWSLARRQSAVGPQRVEIIANMLCSGGDESDVLFWRGAAAIALCDKLEAAGYMVRLVYGFGGKHYSNKVSCRIMVKDHDKPLDQASTSAVILPGFFRGLGHAWILGHCGYEAESPGISVEQCVVEAGEIILSHEVRSESTAIAWLNKQIAAINAQFEQAA